MKSTDGKPIFVRIAGMYCPRCAEILADVLGRVEGVASVRFSGHVAEIATLPGAAPKPAQIVNAVRDAGYETRYDWISDRPPPRLSRHLGFLAALLSVTAFGWALRHAFGIDLLGSIPSVGDETTLAAIFLAGLMTSLHCAGMCGALMIGGTLGADGRPLRNAIAYNSSRLASYAATGAAVGAAGAVISPGPAFRGALQVAAGVAMLLVALRMAGLTGFPSLPMPPRPHLPPTAKRRLGGILRPALLGLATGLMPCGPLQAMQLWALGSGSAARGAAGLLFFGLGTLPLLFAFGAASASLAARRGAIARIAAALLTALAAGMVLRGLRAWGIDPVPGVAAFDCCEVREPPGPDGTPEAADPPGGDGPIAVARPGADGFVAVPVSRLGKKALFIDVPGDGAPTVQLVAILDDSGEARIAFNTCQSCSPSPRAFFTQRDDGRLVCGQCGNAFGPEAVGASARGCNPAVIPGVRVSGGMVLVPSEAIEAARPAFANWAGPHR